MAGSSDGNGYWRELSDAELRGLSFTTRNPETLDGLVEAVPSPDGTARVEMSYDFRLTKRAKIRCAHCGFPNHLWGYVIRQGEARFLCGNDCGAKIYGADFEGLDRDFRGAQKRAGYLVAVGNLQQALPTFRAYLAALQFERSLGTYEELTREVASKIPRLRGALLNVLQRPDRLLTIDEQARDFDAEARDEDRYERELKEWGGKTLTLRQKLTREGQEPKKSRKPIWKMIEKPIGVAPVFTFMQAVDGPRKIIGEITVFFDALAAPAHELSKAEIDRLYAYDRRRDRLGEIARVGLQFGDTSNAGMAKLLKKVTELLTMLEAQLRRLEEIQTFFEPANLELLATWANARRLAGEYSAGPGALTFVDSKTETVRILIKPTDLSLPSSRPILAFRRAIYPDR